MTITRTLVELALTTATDTRHLTLHAGAVQLTATAFRATFGERPAVVVADLTTWSVAGQRVEQVLRRAGLVTRPPVVLSAPLHANFDRVLELQAAIAKADATPVAVGSGTINDLTKLAAHRLNRPYMVVATAASMDGYAAFGASITRDGFKQTMACPAPAGIVADLDILAAAPTPLTAAGYGDLLGKVTAGADWIVADALEVEAIDVAAWELVQGPLGEAVGSPERLRAHELAATEQFFLGLLLPPAELRRRLHALGAASLPGEIGVGPARLRSDLLAARQIRRRYTMLDLAAEVGLLERCVDEVVAVVAQSRGVSPEHDGGHSGRSGRDGRAPRGAPRASQ